MSAKQRGSKIDQYADKPLASDELYSNTNRDDPAMKAAEIRRKTQNGAYKNALRDTRSKDPDERASGYKRALDMQNQGYQPQSNIPGDGEYDGQNRKYADNHTREGLVLEEQARKRQEAELGNNSPASPPVPVPGGAAAPAGGAGSAPYTPIPTTKPSVSAPTPSAGQSATPGATTPPVAQGGAGNGKPAVPEWQQKRTAALEALRGKFTEQDAANALAKETEPKGIDPLYQASEKEMAEPQTDSRMPTRSAKEPTPEEAKAAKSTAAFGKAYAAYLNGAGKTASKEEKDAKYAELKSSVGLTVKPGDGGMEMPAAPKLVREPSAKSVERSGLDLKLQAEMNQALDQSTGKVNDITDSLGGKIDSSLEFKTESDRKYEAAIAPSRDALKKFEAETPGREANIEKNYQDGRAYVAQLGEDRALHLEDVVRNSEDFLSYGGYKRHITGVRKDAKSPEVDWDAFDKRQPGDPNYGAKRYESQYDANGDFKAADYVQSKAPSNPSTYAPATMGGGLIERKKTESGPSSRETLEAFKLKQQENKKKFPGQASVDNKLQQHHASIEASKGVLQGARKITDDIWGSDYNTVPA